MATFARTTFNWTFLFGVEAELILSPFKKGVLKRGRIRAHKKIETRGKCFNRNQLTAQKPQMSQPHSDPKSLNTKQIQATSAS